MNRMFRFAIFLSGLFFAFALFSRPACGETPDKNIVSRTAEVDGVKLHYLTAGHGPAVILLHGYAETSRMWRPIIPLLAEKFTVIAPDLPGIGESSIPADKIEMKTSASRIHSLVRSLGVEKARVVGQTKMPDVRRVVDRFPSDQFRKRSEKPTRKRIRNRDGCAQRGPISLPGRSSPKTFLSFRKPNL